MENVTVAVLGSIWHWITEIKPARLKFQNEKW